MEQKASIKELLGCLPQGLLGNFLVGALALVLGIALGRPKIFIDLNSAIGIFCALLLVYLAITSWCISTLAKNHLMVNLVTAGPYRFVRHPMYAAIIFILNPALAFLLRSWWLLLATVPIYFVWRHCAKSEDRHLAQKFSEEFLEYRRRVWPLFPNFWRINKILFYALSGILVFTTTFVSLNLSAFYLRWVKWEKDTKITYDQPNQEQAAFPLDPGLPIADDQFWPETPGDNNSPAPPSASQPSVNIYVPNYNARANSIIIREIGLEAPLIFSSGTSQKELNAALNQGVIIYPGSARPGQNGEVFVSGHSSVFPWVETRYGQVFTLLDKLKKGDVVSLIFEHRQYDYRVTGKEVLFPNQVKIYETSEPRLTLMTCWPIGTALKRLVVRTELIR